MQEAMKEQLKSVAKAKGTTIETLVEALLAYALANLDLTVVELPAAKKRGRKPGQKAAVAPPAEPVAEAPVTPA